MAEVPERRTSKSARTGSDVALARGMRTAFGAVLLAFFVFSPAPANAQARDRLLNGPLIGAAVGAGVGIAFTHAVRDSDLTAGQYARSAVIFGALGAGAGLGLDALLSRTHRPVFTQRRLSFAPAVWRDTSAVLVKWRW